MLYKPWSCGYALGALLGNSTELVQGNGCNRQLRLWAVGDDLQSRDHHRDVISVEEEEDGVEIGLSFTGLREPRCIVAR